MIFEIPLNSENASFKIRTILDDVEVVLLINWNDRIERWVLSIFDPSEVPLISGLPLHINTELLERFEVIGLPPGKMMLFDTTLQFIECPRDGLGDKYKLLYEDITPEVL